MRKNVLLLIIFMFGNAYGMKFESGKKRVNLVELYTSQSCSSCPPAEKWLSNLKSSKKIWKEIVPVSFHVTYWNHLSWKDKFSKKRFSERQRIYNSKISSGVYTPQVILNGFDYRKWRNTNKLVRQGNPGNLVLTIKKSQAKLEFASKKKEHLLCQLAVLKSNSTTAITDGENEGKVLKEDFIVRDFYQMTATKTKQGYKCELNIKGVKTYKETAVAGWIARASTYEVVQAVGGTFK